MKRGAMTVVCLLAALAPAVRGEDLPAEPVSVEEVIFEDLRDWDRSPREKVPHGPALPDGPQAAAEALLRRIRESPLCVRATAYRFDLLPAALEAWGAGAFAVFGPKEAAAVATHAREGSLVLLHAVCAAGPAGTELLGRDLERTSAVLRREIEGAQAAVVSFPRVSFLRAGLRLRARFEPAAVGGVTLSYRVTLADAPVRETRASLGGSLDYVSVPALQAQGTVRLVPGEAAAILRVEKDGSGRLVLLTLTGRLPDVGAVTDLGDDHVAVLAGHLTATELRPAARMSGVVGFSAEAEDREPSEDVFEAFAEAAGVGEAYWDDGPFGLRFAVVQPAARGKLARLLIASASLRGTRSRVDVAREGWGHMAMPVAPGTAFRFFAGRVGTAWHGTEVQSGCNTCVMAAPITERACRGLMGAGWASADGTVDFDLAGREVLGVEYRTFELRRIEAGYLGYARDPFEVPFVRERILECRGALPAGHGRLAGGVRLRFRLDPLPLEAWVTAVPAPVSLEIQGEPVPLRPGVASWFALQTRHPFVRRWQSEGWCGMRARYPVPDRSNWMEDGTRVGTSLALRVRQEDGVLLLDVQGEVRGEPEDLGLFDPGDGQVRIVRSPRLRIDVGALPLGGGGQVAHGAGLALVIDRKDVDIEPGPHLRLECRAGRADAAGFLTGRGAGGLLDAGADWLLPSAFSIQSSSHQAGQVSTVTVPRKDGIVLRVEPSARHARVDVRLRSRPTLVPYRLKVDTEPDRPENEHTLLGLGRRATGCVLYLDVDGRLDYRSPDLSSPLEVSARIVSAGGGK